MRKLFKRIVTSTLAVASIASVSVAGIEPHLESGTDSNLISCTSQAQQYNAEQESTTPNMAENGTEMATSTWTWQGSAMVDCSDGVCRLIVDGGVVYGGSQFQAEINARAEYERRIRSQGGRVRGQVSISVTIRR